MRLGPSTSTVFAAESMVCSVDHLASSAALAVLGEGGTAADAAIAANAVLVVTQQQMNGLGGDLWAMVYEPGGAVHSLNASGRAGSGADPDRLRSAGADEMPHRGDIASAPVPGCVDGWVALHDRFGSLPFERLLRAGTDLADGGFAASAQLAQATSIVGDVAGNTDLVDVAAGQRVRRPGVARTLRAIADHGRDGFYGGEFGEALLELGAGEYVSADLAMSQADWVETATAEAWGHTLHTTPPNSQGYLSLAGAAIATEFDLPDPQDPLFAHLLIESARAAAFDRPDVLHEHADAAALLGAERLALRRARIDPNRATVWGDGYAGGGTMYLCVVDGNGMGVSFIQSNAAGFGSHLVVGDTGVFLHNRGIGFNLQPGHPAEYGPGRRPPHTLAPAVITGPGGSLRSVLGTMGGDAQPQVVLQMMARLLHADQRPGAVISAGRFALTSPGPTTGFDTWSAGGDVHVHLEASAAGWADGLTKRGHHVEQADAYATGFGHAHMIEVLPSGSLAGASDPRARASAALGR